MLCRNRVVDFGRWKRVFDSHADAAREAGLTLVNLWRGLEDQNDVFFLLEVSDLEKARAFVTSPEGEETGKIAGVIDGEIHFLSSPGAGTQVSAEGISR
jgi:hypothetical protein